MKSWYIHGVVHECNIDKTLAHTMTSIVGNTSINLLDVSYFYNVSVRVLPTQKELDHLNSRILAMPPCNGFNKVMVGILYKGVFVKILTFVKYPVTFIHQDQRLQILLHVYDTTILFIFAACHFICNRYCPLFF